MEYMLEQIGENIVWMIVGVCFIVGMLVKALTSVVTAIAREKSRREIAAYIAEGSMTPDQGERLLAADVNRASRDT